MKRSFQHMAFLLKNLKIRKNKNGGAHLLFIFLFGLLLLALVPQYLARESVLVDTSSLEEKVAEPITLLFVGDIMLDRGIRSTIEKHFGGDYGALFENTGYIKDADIAFANLEGPVAEESTKRLASRMLFRMDPDAMPALKNAGLDIVSFANNHVGDYQRKAFLETLEHLKTNDILYAGAGHNITEARTPAIIEVQGVRVGYLAVADIGPEWMNATEKDAGIILGNDPELSRIITDAKALVDVLVVSFHWGNEYSAVSARQEELAHRAIDAGADIVVGHHPHVMQKFEYYKNKPVFYSLGNFIFDQYFSEHTMRGMAGKVTIDPQTLVLEMSAEVSPLSKQYIPQPIVPFDVSMLITKSFTP